jgi:putative DNA modification/repair radical SAM protein
MADLVDVCSLLRKKHKFNGYIHLKVIPGAAKELVHEAGMLVDRLSVNIELPSETSLKQLAPQKSKKSIIDPMKQIGDTYTAYRREKKTVRNSLKFCPGGQSTQIIVGASAESDLQILNLTSGLYKNMNLKRVYYSAYVAVNNAPQLPVQATAPPLLREHRLYQADWLLRCYRFQAHEILSPAFPNLEDKIDPKASWALRNFDLFPLDINRASYEELLRVPGIGLVSARRILSTRKRATIRLEDLKKIGLVMKRARYFITINGRRAAEEKFSYQQVVTAMQKIEKPAAKKLMCTSRQLRLF